MKKNARSIEGFVPRSKNKPRPTLDGSKSSRIANDDLLSPVSPNRYTDSFTGIRPKKSKGAAPKNDIDADIMDSLADLPGYNSVADDSFSESKGLNRKALKKIRPKSSKKGKKKPLKIFLVVATILVLLAVGIFMALKYLWPDETIEGNFWEVFHKEKLQEDENGRSNILIFGTEPEGYDGADLTDSIMVLSLNQTDGSAYTVSLPRDLYVKHNNCPNFGTTSGRLNETYACVINGDYSNEDEAAEALRGKVGEILGLDVQYNVHLNWAGFEQIIDSVGGVEITIESSDPRGIYDVSTNIKFPNGPVHLDGATALAIARARGSYGGYGLETSNFAREIHQQKIVKSLTDRVISNGVLTDPVQALNLMNTLGDNLQTNFRTNEIQALAEVGKTFNSDDMIRLPLLDPDNGIKLVTNDMINGASVVVPTAGVFVYTEIQAYIKKSMSSDPIVREAAVINVLNGTDQPGLAQIKADELEEKGYTVGVVGNAAVAERGAIEVYQIDDAKTGTAKALAKLFEIEVKNVIPAGVDTTGAAFVIIIGQALTN